MGCAASKELHEDKQSAPSVSSEVNQSPLDNNPERKTSLLRIDEQGADWKVDDSSLFPNSNPVEAGINSQLEHSNSRRLSKELPPIRPASILTQVQTDSLSAHEQMMDTSYSMRSQNPAGHAPSSPTSTPQPLNPIKNAPFLGAITPQGSFDHMDPHQFPVAQPFAEMYQQPHQPFQMHSLEPQILSRGKAEVQQLGIIQDRGMGGRGSRGRGGRGPFGPYASPFQAPLLMSGNSGNAGRGAPIPGRGRGRPVQVMIPQHARSPSGNHQLPIMQGGPALNINEHAAQFDSKKPKRLSSSSGDDDDDDDDDILNEDEQVSDWGDDETEKSELPKKTHQLPAIAPHDTLPNLAVSPSQHQLSPIQKTSPSKPPSKVKNFRPAFEAMDDIFQNVESGSDDDTDDDDDTEAGEGDNEGVHDWFEADSEHTTVEDHSKPTRYPSRERISANIESKRSAGNVKKDPPTPTASSVPSPHPPALKQPSNRAIPTGPNTSPTRGTIVPLGGPGSPANPGSYRSNIVASRSPAMAPIPAESMIAKDPNAAIRDTKVVKKKKAELPQHNLPHPVPKFGDWLNSRTMINNYIILEALGAGSYAEVKLCKEKVSGKLFAMKFINRDIMKKDKLGKQSKLDDIKREIAIMKKLHHPNVLRLYEVMDDPKMNKLFLVLEYMKYGDLLSHQKKKHPNGTGEYLHDRDLHCVFLQVILGLAYLHEQKIVHGDIKPQNLLVGDKDVVKIADFGISQSLYGSKQKLTDTAGTPAFMSPEMCSGEEYSGQLADIWAVGATFFMLKFGNPPFVAKSAMQIFEKIQNDPLVFPSAIDPSLEALLRGMLIKDPLKRMTLLDVMTHPWVTKKESSSHFLMNHHPAPQITVSKDEIEQAIDPKDRFTIIVNTRIQLMKRLHKARIEILSRHGHNEPPRPDSGDGVSTTAGEVSVDTSTASHLAAPVEAGKSLSKHSSKIRHNKIHADAADMNGDLSTARERRMLSSEEIEYRAQLFSRKKPSAVLTQTQSKSANDVSGKASGDGDSADQEDLKDDEHQTDDDVLSSDDDEAAVAQSPQLLDELLLTTLSMPPLSRSKSKFAAEKTASAIRTSPPSESTSDDCTHHHQEASSANAVADSQAFYGLNTQLRMQFGVSSLQARRNTQEDRWVVLPSIPDAPAKWSSGAFVGLYDGHGGEECANILQEQLHHWIFRNAEDTLLDLERLQSCYLELDLFVCDYLQHKGDLSGSTATCLLLCPDLSASSHRLQAIVSHVGDCRLVLGKRNGDCVDLTTDHRLTLAAERDRILQRGGRVVNNRVNGVMAITRAFGDLEFKGMLDRKRASSSTAAIEVQPNLFQSDDDEKTPALLTARPDVALLTLDPLEHEFLLLACDGLWDVMTSEEALATLRDRFSIHGDLQLAAKEIAQEAIRRYSNDNISVIALHLAQ